MTTRLPLVTVAFAAMFAVLVLTSCSDSPTSPGDLESRLLEYSIGDQVIFRYTQLADGEEFSVDYDTTTVVSTSLMDGEQLVQWDDGTEWRLKDGVLQVGAFGAYTTIGAVPTPEGRWPEPVDSMEYTDSNGQVLGMAYEIFVTRSRNTQVTVPAGPFQCSVVDVHYETNSGQRLDDEGTGRYAYAPGIGPVQLSLFNEGEVNGQPVDGEYRVELFKIIRE